ncbi:MAG TPA: NAD regulator [Kaistiaceae bacterium]|mgnify:CR=1 FL=1|nr:NAD regulator [Kaistiaceae bacterium]
MSGLPRTAIEIGLNAAIVAVDRLTPLILVTAPDGRTDALEALPFGPFDPIAHRTLEIGLRSWVEEQTALPLGHVEQLYTFGDRGRHATRGDTGPHALSVGYLALTRLSPDSEETLSHLGAQWRPWYCFFPWEDWRAGRPAVLDEVILPLLREWATARPDGKAPARALPREVRLRLAFGEDEAPWDEERTLDRYELLYEAGLLEEARRDGRSSALARGKLPALGRPMRYDHRRIVATAISRLRAKLKYRPVVFELMPEEFTLTELQQTVEAISGRHLHKQNFRRLVENAELVEPTGALTARTGGRPAALFRFRRDILQERPAPGLRVGGRA